MPRDFGGCLRHGDRNLRSKRLRWPRRAVAALAQRQASWMSCAAVDRAHGAGSRLAHVQCRSRRGERAGGAGARVGKLLQFLTRFTGVPVAPGFFFMAGFMVALTSVRARGPRRAPSRYHAPAAHPRARADRRRRPDHGTAARTDGVLFVHGAELDRRRHHRVALLRDVSSKVLAAGRARGPRVASAARRSALPVALRAMLYEPVRTGAFRSLYPIIPWIASSCSVRGRARCDRGATRPAQLLVALAALCLAVVPGRAPRRRLWQRLCVRQRREPRFWLFAKYPPDLAFLSWSFACVFLSLAVLRSSLATACRAGCVRS